MGIGKALRSPFRGIARLADSTAKVVGLKSSDVERVTGWTAKGPRSSPVPLTDTRSIAKYNAELRTLSNDDLDFVRQSVKAQLDDAGSGPSRDPRVAARAGAELKLIDEERVVRQVWAQGPNGDFALQMHGLDDKPLQDTRKIEQERFKEATTGSDRNPELARQSSERLEVIGREQLLRIGDQHRNDLPKVANNAPLLKDKAVVKYAEELRTMPRQQLVEVLAGQRAVVRDATTGMHSDGGEVKNATLRQMEARHELATREFLSAGPMPEYTLSLRQMDKKELKKEQKALKQGIDESTRSGSLDPEGERSSRAKLSLLEGELTRRKHTDVRDILNFGGNEFLKAS